MIIYAAVAPATGGGGGGSAAVTIAIIMAIASVVGTALGGWYTFRAARRNAEVTRETERDKLGSVAWAGWREDVETLRRQRKEDADSHEVHKRECREQIAFLSSKVQAQDARLEEMDRKHDIERDEFRRTRSMLENKVDALVHWGRLVVMIMRTRGVEFPTPPPGVADTEEFPLIT